MVPVYILLQNDSDNDFSIGSPCRFSDSNNGTHILDISGYRIFTFYHVYRMHLHFVRYLFL